jgi:hypothetical protein
MLALLLLVGWSQTMPRRFMGGGNGRSRMYGVTNTGIEKSAANILGLVWHAMPNTKSTSRFEAQLMCVSNPLITHISQH